MFNVFLIKKTFSHIMYFVEGKLSNKRRVEKKLKVKEIGYLYPSNAKATFVQNTH